MYDAYYYKEIKNKSEESGDSQAFLCSRICGRGFQKNAYGSSGDGNGDTYRSDN